METRGCRASLLSRSGAFPQSLPKPKWHKTKKRSPCICMGKIFFWGFLGPPNHLCWSFLIPSDAFCEQIPKIHDYKAQKLTDTVQSSGAWGWDAVRSSQGRRWAALLSPRGLPAASLGACSKTNTKHYRNERRILFGFLQIRKAGTPVGLS